MTHMGTRNASPCTVKGQIPGKDKLALKHPFAFEKFFRKLFLSIVCLDAKIEINPWIWLLQGSHMDQNTDIKLT